MNRLLATIDIAEMVFTAGIPWAEKYDILFAHYQRHVSPGLLRLGLTFTWHDPDASYEDDVRAYMRALLDFRECVLSPAVAAGGGA